MTFNIGETVVYPHHGAAVIESTATRSIRGEERLYLKLRVLEGDLVIEVPAENCDLVGVRDVVDARGVQQVFSVLSSPVPEEPANWSRRFKANSEKVSSGDVFRIAEVVRDLSRRESERGVSTGEKRILTRARAILASELALALETDIDQAHQQMDDVLQQ